MSERGSALEFIVGILFCIIFSVVSISSAQSTPIPKPEEKPAEKPAVDNPSPAELKKRMESEKPYTDCKKNEAKLEKDICNTGPSAGASMSRNVNGRIYECEKGKLKSASGLTPRPNGQGGFECITEREVAERTGNTACANLSGSTNPAEPNTCVAGLRPVPTGTTLTLAEVQKMKERTGIKCMLFKGKLVEAAPRTRFSDIAAERQLAATTPTGADLEVCADDAHKLQGSTEAQTKPGVVAREPVTPTKPAVVAREPATPTKPAVIAREPAAPAKPAVVGNESVTPKPAVVARDTVTEAKPAPFVANNQQGQTGPTVAKANPVTSPTGQQYKAPQERPTGVQTGREQGGTQQQQKTNTVAQSTTQKGAAWLSSWLTPQKNTQQQNESVIVINNNQPQPWFLAEMKRMEEARARAEAERKALEEKIRREKEAKDKLAKDASKKIVKKTSDSKKDDGAEDAKKEEQDSQAVFLKALMDAPSIEEIAKQYEEEQKKENEQYQNQNVKIATTPKKQEAPTSEKSGSQSERSSETQKVTITNPSAQKKQTTQAYSDIKPPLDSQEGTETLRSKSSLVSMLDEEAIKKGIPAPRIEDMPLPQKIAFTRTSYTVVVPTVRQTIKTIMRAYQKASDLTQLERDRHAAQLMALSEQLAGSAYGADYDTTQVLNDAARATELTAFMIAEHADSKAVEDSLYGVFATLTPLTKDEPVALTPPSGSVTEWSEQHFALIKYKIETALADTKNQKAQELYMRALSLVKSAELYKDSDQQYWNSSADIKEAVRTLSLATALDRASRAAEREETTSPTQEQNAKAREALLKDKGAEKGIWSSFLNMLGL